MSTYRRLIVVFALLLLALPAAAQDATPTPLPTFPLTVGVPVEFNITDAAPENQFAFQGTAGATVLLFMEATSGDLNPFVLLLDPNGDLIAQNDDLEVGVRDAAIQTALPVDGTYTVIATRSGRDNGVTTGSYALLLEIEGAPTGDGTPDPLAQNPENLFSVPVTPLAYQDFAAGRLNAANPRRYFAVGGEEGDLLRAIITITEGDLSLAVNILGSDLTRIGSTVRPRDNEIIAFATLPRRDWYLIEVTREGGGGTFSLFADGLAVPRLTFDTPAITGELTVNAPAASFIFDGTLGDRIFSSVAVTEGEASPVLRVLDIAQREIASAEGSRFTSLQTTLPRSGTYILEIENTTPDAPGAFNLRANIIETTIESLAPAVIEYNSRTEGALTDANPQDVYAFEGSQGDIINAEMVALVDALDPLLILMDENLNELVVNDNSRGSRDARLVQYALPANGTYYLVAGRSGLSLGESFGTYDLALTVGAIALVDGALAATVRWNGDDDLNLFIREPTGRVISWSNPEPADSGELQIDSNTNCTAISAQPVEHIYWDADHFPQSGDYEIWVWYQNACGTPQPVAFAFQLLVDGAVLLDVPEQLLEQGERFNVDVRVSDDEVFVLDRGRVTQPSPQQRASEGGDIPILYGEAATGSISDEVYARFYQFEGGAGDRVVIEVEAVTGNLDPVLVLRDDTETNLVEADDITRENRNARITYELPDDGRYVIAVTRFGVREGLTVGDYRLSLVRQTVE